MPQLKEKQASRRFRSTEEILPRLTHALTRSTDVSASLSLFLEVLTDEVCDGCMIELREDGGLIRRSWIAPRDPQARKLLEQTAEHLIASVAVGHRAPWITERAAVSAVVLPLMMDGQVV